MIDLDICAAEIANARKALTPFVEYANIPDVETGYAIQDRVTQLSGPVGGYKISWNAPGLPQKFGVSEPGAGRVHADRILPNQTVLNADHFATIMLEPEVAAVLGRDIPNGAYTADSIAPFVRYLVPAFEVLDRRIAPSFHGPSIIAGNVFNAGLVLGEASGTTLGRTTVKIGTEVVLNAESSAPQNPYEALAYVVNLMQARGDVMRAGQVVLCGSHTPLLPIEPGQTAVMSVAGLGEVRLQLR